MSISDIARKFLDSSPLGNEQAARRVFASRGLPLKQRRELVKLIRKLEPSVIKETKPICPFCDEPINRTFFVVRTAEEVIKFLCPGCVPWARVLEYARYVGAHGNFVRNQYKKV